MPSFLGNCLCSCRFCTCDDLVRNLLSRMLLIILPSLNIRMAMLNHKNVINLFPKALIILEKFWLPLWNAYPNMWLCIGRLCSCRKLAVVICPCDKYTLMCWPPYCTSKCPTNIFTLKLFDNLSQSFVDTCKSQNSVLKMNNTHDTFLNMWTSACGVVDGARSAQPTKCNKKSNSLCQNNQHVTSLPLICGRLIVHCASVLCTCDEPTLIVWPP